MNAQEASREPVKKPFPAIAIIVDQTLQHGHGGFSRAARTDRNFAEKGWNSGKVCNVGEKAADFHVGIFFRLQSAEEFEEKLFSENDRRV